MKTITLTAEEEVILQARASAKSRKTTLNQLFRDWLATLAGQAERERQLADLPSRLSYLQTGGPFTREQMNER